MLDVRHLKRSQHIFYISLPPSHLDGTTLMSMTILLASEMVLKHSFMKKD